MHSEEDYKGIDPDINREKNELYQTGREESVKVDRDPLAPHRSRPSGPDSLPDPEREEPVLMTNPIAISGAFSGS